MGFKLTLHLGIPKATVWAKAWLREVSKTREIKRGSQALWLQKMLQGQVKVPKTGPCGGGRGGSGQRTRGDWGSLKVCRDFQGLHIQGIQGSEFRVWEGLFGVRCVSC